MRADSVRAEVARMVHQAPFRPFVLSMENGDRVTIGHPENIAFDPASDSPDFYVISGRCSCRSLIFRPRLRPILYAKPRYLLEILPIPRYYGAVEFENNGGNRKIESANPSQSLP
jgi:hypothetical protein